VASIDLQHVSVAIPIYNSRGRALKSELFRRAVGGNIDVNDKSITVVRALDDITCQIEHGDRIALIGGNGAGKTTLLRVLSRIYPPTSGRVEIIGRVSSLTDFTVGMDPEATGYENIVMRGIVLGLTAKQATALTPDIEEFTELGEYLRLPIRTYSAGMMLRLAFAISTAVKPDIVILDELISAGDASFIKKARMRIEALITNASIMVFASHDVALIQQLCTSAIWLDHGRIMAKGETNSVLHQYSLTLSDANTQT
jgi:ABC-type polysaccharide/polyol phosphate transport system ATPase subunit